MTITVKVKTVDPSEKVRKRDGQMFKKQDCVVADSEGCCRVVLWEHDVGRLKEDECYRLEKMFVRSYREMNFLSIGKESEMVEVDDIGETA